MARRAVPHQTNPSVTVTTSLTYDALNRPTSKTYSDGTAAVNYSYDQSSYNGLTITNGIGRLTGMSDGSGQTAWSYDAAGRILTERRTIAGVTKTISYGYNLDGSLASNTYPSGRTVSYSYGNAERAVSAVDSANGINYATNATYAPQGGPGSILHGEVSGGFAGITETYSYNNRLQPTAVQARTSTATLMSLAYSFAQPLGNDGKATSIANNRDNGRSQTFAYDPLGRILSAQTQATSGADCWGLAFGSGGLADDRYSNLLAASVMKCSAPMLSLSANTNNQITNTGFTYDAAGNLTNDGTYAYTYDAEDRITSAGGVNYTYDGKGLRLDKSSGILYWRNFAGQTLAESDLSGNVLNEYVFFASRRIARRDASGNVFYYFSDHLGSTRVIANAQGTVCHDADYYPYGGELPFTNTCAQNYKFTGYERDSETGLDYAFARYYSSRLGRFMTHDVHPGDRTNLRFQEPGGPMDFMGADTGPKLLNRYAYVGNDPLNFRDPGGTAILGLEYF